MKVKCTTKNIERLVFSKDYTLIQEAETHYLIVDESNTEQWQNKIHFRLLNDVEKQHTNYDDIDLISFGTYLYSSERKAIFIDKALKDLSDGLTPIGWQKDIQTIYPFDIINWKDEKAKETP